MAQPHEATVQIDLEDAIASSWVAPEPLGPLEQPALEYLQHEIRRGHRVTPADVSGFLINDRHSPIGGDVIESLISKGYLARQFTVLRPTVREVVKVNHEAGEARLRAI